MDQFEVDLEENDHVGGIDRMLIGFGVAAMAMLPTLFYSIFKPAKIAPFLDGVTKPSDRRGGVIGPGIFFVLSIFFFVIVFASFRNSDSKTSETQVAEEISRGAEMGRGIGRGVRTLIEGLSDNLAEGNLWSAIAIAFPIYLFAVYMGLMGTLIFRGVSEKWSARESMGAGLYVFGGWLCLTTVLVLILTFPLERSVRGAIVMLAIIMQLFLIGWQYYALVKHTTQAEDYKIIPRAALMPLILILGFVSVIFAVS